MRILIHLDLGNAAFEDNGNRETARILRSLAYSIQDTYPKVGDFERLWDINGNAVGHYEVTA